MSDDNDGREQRASGVSTRTVEIVTALLVLIFSVILIADAVRLGSGWASDGPQAGFYPFYIGLLMGAAALTIIVQQWVGSGPATGRRPFVEPGKFGLVLSMLLPSVAYVAAIYGVGLYVSSAVFLLVFMMWQGKFSLLKSLPVSLAVPLSAFMLFEIWFKVPLPKGPLEALLGY